MSETAGIVIYFKKIMFDSCYSLEFITAHFY